MWWHRARQPRPAWSDMSVGLVLAAGLLAGCSNADSHAKVPTPEPTKASTGASSDPCLFSGAFSGDLVSEGPVVVAQPSGTALHRPRRGGLQDISMTQLINEGSETVVLDGIALPDRDRASPLRCTGAFVAPPGSNLVIHRAGHSRRLRPVEGYRLRPVDETLEPPVLVLRIGPSRPGQVNGARLSGNSFTIVYYHAADGTQYKAAMPVWVEYPNKAE